MYKSTIKTVIGNGRRIVTALHGADPTITSETTLNDIINNLSSVLARKKEAPVATITPPSNTQLCTAVTLFQEAPDVFGASAIIGYLSRAIKFEKNAMEAAFMIYKTLVKTTKPDIGVFRALTSVCRKSNEVEEAIKVWHEMVKYKIDPDKVLFGCFTAACASIGDGLVARQLLTKADGKLPFLLNKIDCTQLIEAFRKAKDLRSAKAVLAFMQKRGIRSDVYVYTTLFSMCAEVVELTEGLAFWNQFQKEPFEKSIVVHNALLTMYLKCARPDLVLLHWRQYHSMKPDTHTYFHIGIAAAAIGADNFTAVLEIASTITRDCRVVKDKLLLACLSTLQDLYGEGVAENTDSNILLAIIAIASASTAQHIHELVIARKLNMNLRLSGGLFQMYKRLKMHQAGVVLWKKCCQELSIDNVLYTTVLQFATTMNDLALVDEIWARIESTVHVMDTTLRSVLLHAYAKCNPQQAITLWPTFHSHDTVDINSYSTMLLACANAENLNEGIKVHEELKGKKSAWDLCTWNSLASMYLKCEAPQHVHALWRDYVSEYKDIPGTLFIVSTLAATSILGDLSFGRDMHKYLRSHTIDLTIGNNLLNMYVECGGNLEAISLWKELCQNEITPDYHTYSSTLTACANLAAKNMGNEIIHHFINSELDPSNIFVNTAMLNMHAKTGDLNAAQQLFVVLKDNATKGQQPLNVVTYNAMLAAYAHHGSGAECIELFHEMVQHVVPTPTTFTSLLTGCSHCGLVAEGLTYFGNMQRTYSITPELEHYNCMVDLLGRAGRLEEAEQFIYQHIPIPNVVTWRTLLGACRIHNDIERAKRALAKLLQLNPLDASAQVMMANIYAAGHDHEAAQQIRVKMMQGGVKKIPGTSTVEVNGAVHTFHVNDHKHPESTNIYVEIGNLKEEAQAAGFKPDLCFVLHEVDEEEKKELLWFHSEKLALAYALLHTPAHTPITIHKNLRVCGDCHTATKLISKLRGRKISVRDASRWHHFVDGKCSCGDYF